MTIVFDLDYTLLDTVKFKDALRDAVTSLGVSSERYEETYKQIVKREGKTYDYDPDAHLGALKDDLSEPWSMTEARARIYKVLARTEEFLYPGSIEMILKYREAGARLVLLTLGNEAWQEAKSRHSGLSSLFDSVLAVGKDKTGALRGIAVEDDKVVVVNDNGNEVKEMIREVEKWKGEEAKKGRGEEGKLPEMHFFLKKGPKPSPNDLSLEAKELDEIEGEIDRVMGISREGSEGKMPLR